MPSMTEEMGRIAGAIAATRQQRMDGVAGLRSDVSKELHAMKTTREMMGMQQRRDLAAGQRKLMSDVQVMMSQLHRSQVESAAAQRAGLAMFVRDLTGRVEALRDAFSVNREARVAACRELAEATHGRLSAYRQDRHDGMSAWNSKLAPKAPPAPIKPMPGPYVKVETAPAMSSMPPVSPMPVSPMPVSPPMASAPRPVSPLVPSPSMGPSIGKNKSST